MIRMQNNNNGSDGAREQNLKFLRSLVTLKCDKIRFQNHSLVIWLLKKLFKSVHNNLKYGD